MSTHPNTILMGVLIPDELARKTYRAIVGSIGADNDDPYFNIGGLGYSLKIMEDSYDDSNQISAPEGSIVAHCLLTYGYGETIAWAEVEKAKAELEAWLANIAAQHKCSHSIHLTASYW